MMDGRGGEKCAACKRSGKPRCNVSLAGREAVDKEQETKVANNNSVSSDRRPRQPSKKHRRVPSEVSDEAGPSRPCRRRKTVPDYTAARSDKSSDSSLSDSDEIVFEEDESADESVDEQDIMVAGSKTGGRRQQARQSSGNDGPVESRNPESLTATSAGPDDRGSGGAGGRTVGQTATENTKKRLVMKAVSQVKQSFWARTTEMVNFLEDEKQWSEVEVKLASEGDATPLVKKAVQQGKQSFWARVADLMNFSADADEQLSIDEVRLAYEQVDSVERVLA